MNRIDSHRLLARILPATVGVILAGFLAVPALAQETLKGQVEKIATPNRDVLEGQVLDAKNGQPIEDAHVTLPDQGFSMQTDKSGRYQIPRYLGKQPLIMSIEKLGYAPFSLSITENAPPVFSIRLQKTEQLLVLDTLLRHLGDGSYSATSSNALNFKKPPDGPAIRIPFSVQGLAISKEPYLQIGSIIGLDTALTHFLTGNNMGVSAGPLMIKLNGAIIAQVQVNGDNQKIQVPSHLLNRTGLNTLEIQAGYHYPEPGRLDYDDMELIHLVLHP